MLTWSNPQTQARIDSTQYVGRYNLAWWPADRLRSPNMSQRRDVDIAAAERFAKRHKIQSFLDAIR